MGLIKCPDCQKEISDTASTCIGCGRLIANAEPIKETAVVERKGGKFELVGTLIILASMAGCSVGLVSSSGGGWFISGVIGFLIGLCVFIYGRFF